MLAILKLPLLRLQVIIYAMGITGTSHRFWLTTHLNEIRGFQRLQPQ